MTRVKTSDFPELRRVFAGYLHEDFLEDYGTPAEALRAFIEEASAAERTRFREETRRFLDCTSDLDFAKLLALVGRLGSRWRPSSREALVSTLSEAANL
jgi:hypothetical protein